MKALHVTASMSPEWGGPVKVATELTAALARLGVHCEIATATGHRVGICDADTPSGVPVHRFETGLPARLWPAYSGRLSGFLDEVTGGFDVVHAHEIWHYAGYAAFRAARKHNVPYVLTVHGALDQWRLRQKWLKKRVYQRLVQDNIINSADALHALTRAEEAQFRELGYETDVFVAPNGVALGPSPGLPDTSGLLAKYPQFRGKRVILFLGRLHIIKGLDVLARAFAAITDEYPDCALLVVGPDEDGSQGRMEAILREAGILHRAVFTGMLTGDDKQAALECADLFVLPSHSEGFSAAVLEALAAGLPVVISGQCHFPEVAESEAGFVVESRGEAVAAAMGRLLSDDALRLRMGRNGRKLVAERYTWAGVAESVYGVYRTLAEKRKLAGAGAAP